MSVICSSPYISFQELVKHIEIKNYSGIYFQSNHLSTHTTQYAKNLFKNNATWSRVNELCKMSGEKCIGIQGINKKTMPNSHKASTLHVIPKINDSAKGTDNAKSNNISLPKTEVTVNPSLKQTIHKKSNELDPIYQGKCIQLINKDWLLNSNPHAEDYTDLLAFFFPDNQTNIKIHQLYKNSSMFHKFTSNSYSSDKSKYHLEEAIQCKRKSINQLALKIKSIM